MSCLCVASAALLLWPEPAHAGRASAKILAGGFKFDGHEDQAYVSDGVDNKWSGNASAWWTAEGDVYARIFLSGNADVPATASLSNDLTYALRPPAGGAFDAERRLAIYLGFKGATISPGNSVLLHVGVAVKNSGGNTGGSFDATVTSQPGKESAEWKSVTSLLPSPQSSVAVTVSTELTAQARLQPGTRDSTSEITVEGTPFIRAFNVIDAAGAVVPGYTLKSADGNVIPERAPPASGTSLAVEYINDADDAYLLAVDGSTIAQLDSRAIRGWTRTGESFNVYTSAAPDRAPVCKFVSVAFQDARAYFYAPEGLDCDAAKSNRDWIYVGSDFLTPLPAADGSCPSGHRPIYRLYNNGTSGFPNHRFTTRPSIRIGMLEDGWTSEGRGDLGVAMCSPQ